MQNVAFAVFGMSCGHCKMSVTKALQAVNGVESVEVDLGAALAKVAFDATKTDVAALRAAVEEAGYSTGDGAGELPLA